MSALGRLRLAIAFLTRLPVRAPEAGPADVAASLAFFPVVGIGLGAVLAALAHLVEGRLPEALVAIVAVAVLVALTGALHLDGLADVFDGLGGGRGDRERMLDLMRDSRIGAHGATALILVLVAKAAAVAAVLPTGNLRALVVFPAIARWLAALLVVAFPYARPEGLGSAFAAHAGAREAVVASAIAIAAIAWAGGGAVVAAAWSLVAVLGLAAWLSRRLGGLTGDVYGAAIEIGEIAFLLAWLGAVGS